MTVYARTQALLREANREHEQVRALCRRMEASIRALEALRDRTMRPFGEERGWEPWEAVPEDHVRALFSDPLGTARLPRN